MNKYLLFIFVLISISCQQPQSTNESNNYKLVVTLENAPFDSLYLCDYTKGRDIFIVGEKKQEFTWEITIPDSIVWDSEDMNLRVSKYDFDNHSTKQIRFIVEREGKKVIVSNIGMENRENYIHATYAEQTVFPNEYISVKIDNKDSIVLGKIIDEDFKLILKNDSSDITVRAQDPYFSWFTNLNNEKISYDEYLAKYIEISKKYPDSRFLIYNLSIMLTKYKSKKDVQKIYENFSNKHKNTLWAKNIERFLYAKFENISLPTFNKNIYEDIIQDNSKYNLIIFTASWCKPCIEEIPILKKIHKNLNRNLILTYISFDEKSSVESFQKIIQEKNIPWRTLFTFENTPEIKNKYFINGIPHCILIYPNQDFEIIEVRNEKQLEKLYSLCNNNSLTHYPPLK